MKEFNKIKGDIGEIKACEYLKKHRYKILEKNYKNKVGEIDIIAMKKKILIFVEVKQRQTLEFGRPSEAVNEAKKHKIIKTAESFLKAYAGKYWGCQFDVIEVLGDEINHIENAFWA